MIDETWYSRPEGVPEHRSAGGVVTRRAGGRILLGLVGEWPRPGYVLPKGHVEPGEDLEAAARREVEEEAGLTNLRLLGPLGSRERLDHAKRGWKVTHYFLFATGQEVGVPTDTSRLYRLEWFSLDDLPPFIWPEQRELLESCRERIEALLRAESPG